MCDSLALMANINGLCLVRHGPNLLHECTAILQVCHVGEQHLARLIGLDVVETRQRICESKTTHGHKRVQGPH